MSANKIFILLLSVLALTALCACGQDGALPSAPTPEITPTPTADIGGVTVTADDESLSLDGVDFDMSELIEAAEVLGSLKTIELGNTGLDMDALDAIAEAYPAAKLIWSVDVDGKSVSSEDTSLELGYLYGDADVSAICLALERLPNIESIGLIGENGYTMLAPERMAELAAAAPEATLKVRFTLYGVDADETTEELRYAGNHIGNEGIEVFRSVIPFLKSLKLLRICECGIDDYDAMQALKDDFPEVNVVWSVDIAGYPFMTDTTLINTNLLNDRTTYLLQYMPDVLYLDIGHDQDLKDLSFVRYFPKLQVVIVSLTHIEDISALEACPDIEYLEMVSTPIRNIEVVAGMEKLEYLNLGCMWNLADITPIYGLKNLKQVRICGSTYDHLPKSQVDELIELMPDCFVSIYGGDPTKSGEWRFNKDGSYTERYALLREQMNYDEPYWFKRMYNSPSAEVTAAEQENSQ